MNKLIDYKLTLIDRVYDLGQDFAEVKEAGFSNERYDELNAALQK